MTKRRNKGEGSIHPHGDRWRAAVVVGYNANGNAVRKVVYGDSKKEVQEKLRDLLDKHAKGKLATTKDTLQAFTDVWLDTQVKHVKDKATEANYRQKVKDHVLPYLGSKKLATLTERDVELWLDRLEADGKTADLRKKLLELFRRILRHAVRRKLIYENVAQNVTPPTVKVQEIDPLSEQQVKQFLAAVAKDRYFLVYLFALDTGCRQGEIIALEWSDLKWETGSVFIHKSAKTGEGGEVRVKETKTPSSRRWIKLTPRTLEVLKGWRQIATGRLMFPARGTYKTVGRERHINKANLLRSFRKALRKAGLPEIRFHDLRHTHATLALARTKNVKAISVRLGHKKIQVTLDTYMHWLPQFEDEIVAAMDEILDFGPPPASATNGEALGVTVPLTGN